AGFSGVKESSSTSLLNMAAQAALGVLGGKASENNMDAPALVAYLDTQKEHILRSIPSGFNLSGALGLSDLADIGSRLSGAFPDVSGNTRNPGNAPGRGDRTADKTKGGSKWLVSLLLIVA